MKFSRTWQLTLYMFTIYCLRYTLFIVHCNIFEHLVGLNFKKIVLFGKNLHACSFVQHEFAAQNLIKQCIHRGSYYCITVNLLSR